MPMTTPSDLLNAMRLAKNQISALAQARTHTEAVDRYRRADGYLQALADVGLLDSEQHSEFRNALSRTYAEWRRPPRTSI